jgi:hypothetical protein
MTKSAILLAISAFSFVESNLGAATITESTTLDFPFFNTGTFPVFLNPFNTNLGTLTSVQLLMTLDVTSSTQVTNDTYNTDPFGTPIFTPLQGLASSTNIIMLNANGLPFFGQTITSPPTPFVIAPVQTGFAQTIAVIGDFPNVPSSALSAFTHPGFAALQFSAQQFVTLTYQPIGAFGPEIQGPTVGDFRASIVAIYNYTPFLGSTLTPEPSTGGLLACAFLGLLVTRAKRRRGV